MYPLVAWTRDDVLARLDALLASGFDQEAIIASHQVVEQLIRRCLKWGANRSNSIFDLRSKRLRTFSSTQERDASLRTYSDAAKWSQAWRGLLTHQFEYPTLESCLNNAMGPNAWSIFKTKGAVRLPGPPPHRVKTGFAQARHLITHATHGLDQDDLHLLAPWGRDLVAGLLDTRSGLSSTLGWDPMTRIPVPKRGRATTMPEAHANRPVVDIERDPSGDIIVSRADMDLVISAAVESSLGRSRILAHPGPSASIHEMLIAFTKDSYIRPHRHTSKRESYQIFRGELIALTFDDSGQIERALPMGDYESGKPFYLRVEGGKWHSFLIQSDYALVHETTNGPLDPEETLFAPWSPDPTQALAVKEFLIELEDTAHTTLN